ncbi:TetR/AcrR family transcriptional regulator [Streptomonospora sp. S1-112]|uniref:TetR/AcrR family transcriptional regulator n=1 Tax=Streptomonospora mangrovi TaxID=2883123 RepID=A0A9X3NIP8_9ACTN|nr:TetR/AcrR family transcriptional regulator [Streptomonospora mangrovi]MDA0564167.1 TetR/AcrR family transcriptional regulator [Streptomonospora mangrovi]
MARPKEFDPEIAVDRAMEVFWRKGYAATTPQDLVDALGIGKGSLYNAFGSKQALFLRALRRYRDSQTEALVETLEQPGPVKQRLRVALTALAEMDLADPDHRGCLAVNTAAERAGIDQEAAEVLRRMLDRTEEAFQALVAEGQRAGEIDPGRDPVALGSMLMNTVVGMRLVSRIAQGPDRLARVIDATVDSL